MERAGGGGEGGGGEGGGVCAHLRTTAAKQVLQIETYSLMDFKIHASC